MQVPPPPENLNLEIPQDPELSEQQRGIARGNLDLTSCDKAQLEYRRVHPPVAAYGVEPEDKGVWTFT